MFFSHVTLIQLLVQCQEEVLRGGRVNTKFERFGQTAKFILKNEGPKAFWRGLEPNLF